LIVQALLVKDIAWRQVLRDLQWWWWWGWRFSGCGEWV